MRSHFALYWIRKTKIMNLIVNMTFIENQTYIMEGRTI